MIYKYLIVFFLLYFPVSSIAQEEYPKFFENIYQDTYTIANQVIDNNTGSGISYVNIKVKNRALGVLSDENGYFILDIDSLSGNDTLQFSRIGYKLEELPVLSIINNKKSIILQNKGIVLPDLEFISSKENWAEELIKKVIDEIPNNYINQPYLLQFNIEKKFIDKRSDKLMLSNVGAEGYFDDGYGEENRRNNFILQSVCYYSYDSASYEWQNVKWNDESYYDILGLYLRDQVKFNENNFLNQKNLKFYDFDLEFEDDNTIVLRFESSNNKSGKVPYSDVLSYQGKIFIEKTNFSISQINSFIVRDYINNKEVKKMSKGVVPTIEISTYYKLGSDGRLYWFKSYYKDNYFLNTEVINENKVLDIGKREMKESIVEIFDKIKCR